MFTGIVQALSTVKEFDGRKLGIEAAQFADALEVGESIAVNGCCLTLISRENGLWFELSEETLERTTMKQLKPGAFVNIERAMRADGRLGGHFVQGHVDTVGSLKKISGAEQSHVLEFSVPKQFGKY